MPQAAHKNIAWQIQLLIKGKLSAKWLLFSSRTGTLSPNTRIDNVSLQSNGPWGTSDRSVLTVGVQVGNSESEAELLLDTRNWLEDGTRLFKVCVTVKI
ncbi:hypothetical protein PDE_01267 [Penicillium oxalicum 114-2]|uniref:Uncharacterized protein n=1 Tax=Penicillium oxalicum (strain 114-2 / CGMCC 5302) TaxID=933388 RepID=S7ZCC1_PENO1|nr:hypothetical protein PDE_01267 [Penicillium oxalicum 114-2]